MAGVKYQNKIKFKEGPIWVLFDENWGLEVTGKEDGIASWDDFKTRIAWLTFGKYLASQIYMIQIQEKLGHITSDKALDLIYVLVDQFDTTEKAEAFANELIKYDLVVD